MLVAWLKPAGPLLAEAFEAALLLVEFFAASGVAHEPEAVLWRRQGDWETGRRGDGETGRRGDGEMGRWGDGEMGRWNGSPESHGPLAKRLSQSAHRPPGGWSRELK
jgi:hypothetical protein